MKKVLALIMALAMVFALVACGPTEGNESTESIEEIIIISSEESTTNTSSNVPVTNTSSQTQTPVVCSHKNVETTPAEKSICGADGKDGKTEGKICKDCGAVLVAAQTIPREEQHYFTMATEDKPATCTVCGLTKGSVKKEPPKAYVGVSTLNINGATLTFSISEVTYVENNTKCNIKYNVDIVNGPNASTYSWVVDVVTGDTGNAIALNIPGSTPTSIGANEKYNNTFETGPVNLTGGYGYRLNFK